MPVAFKTYKCYNFNLNLLKHALEDEDTLSIERLGQTIDDADITVPMYAYNTLLKYSAYKDDISRVKLSAHQLGAGGYTIDSVSDIKTKVDSSYHSIIDSSYDKGLQSFRGTVDSSLVQSIHDLITRDQECRVPDEVDLTKILLQKKRITIIDSLNRSILRGIWNEYNGTPPLNKIGQKAQHDFLTVALHNTTYSSELDHDVYSQLFRDFARGRISLSEITVTLFRQAFYSKQYFMTKPDPAKSLDSLIQAMEIRCEDSSYLFFFKRLIEQDCGQALFDDIK